MIMKEDKNLEHNITTQNTDISKWITDYKIKFKFKLINMQNKEKKGKIKIASYKMKRN